MTLSKHLVCTVRMVPDSCTIVADGDWEITSDSYRSPQVPGYSQGKRQLNWNKDKEVGIQRPGAGWMDVHLTKNEARSNDGERKSEP